MHRLECIGEVMEVMSRDICAHHYFELQNGEMELERIGQRGCLRALRKKFFVTIYRNVWECWLVWI